MRKEQAKDIAIALVAISGDAFDGEAFGASDLPENDMNKVLKEIQSLCEKMKSKIERKYGINLPSDTSGIVDSILYE